MKQTLLKLLATLVLCSCTFAADAPTGPVSIMNASAEQVLPVYEKLSGLELIVDSRVKAHHPPITLQTTAPLPKNELLSLIEKALREQAAIIVTRLDDKRVSVTYNDALPIVQVGKPLPPKPTKNPP